MDCPLFAFFPGFSKDSESESQLTVQSWKNETIKWNSRTHSTKRDVKLNPF